MKAALYIRVSTEEQVKHGLSLDEQKHDLMEYCKNKHYEIFDTYEDDGISAHISMNNRPELQRLIQDVKNHRIDIIVLKCLDRFFRNVKDFYAMQDILDTNQVHWECTQEDYNTTTTNGRLMLNLKLSIAQHEAEQTSDRIRYIFEGKRRRHEVTNGRAPIGYKVIDKKLVINPKTAPFVKWCFNSVLSGGSKNSLVKLAWTEYGINMYSTYINRLLKNRTYIGEVYGIKEFCEPIIDRETFERVQKLSKKRKRVINTRPYLFSGLIICPICKRAMPGCSIKTKTAGTRKVYRCHESHLIGLQACAFGGSINEKKLEDYLIAHLPQLLHDEQAKINIQSEQLMITQKKRASLKTKLTRLKDIYLDGVISKNEFKKEYDKLIAQINTLPATNIRSLSIEKVKVGSNFCEDYKNLTEEGKRKFWQTIIDRIEIKYKKINAKRNEYEYIVFFT